MQIPIVFFLVLYLIALGFFIVGSSFVIYHALRFGQASSLNKITMGIYVAVSLFIIAVSFWYASAIDWAASIDVIEAFGTFFL